MSIGSFLFFFLEEEKIQNNNYSMRLYTHIPNIYDQVIRCTRRYCYFMFIFTVGCCKTNIFKVSEIIWWPNVITWLPIKYAHESESYITRASCFICGIITTSTQGGRLIFQISYFILTLMRKLWCQITNQNNAFWPKVARI